MRNMKRRMLSSARRRARREGTPFNLTEDDINIPETCPALGIPLQRGVGGPRDGSPALDRFIPNRGYVRGNVAVISHRANSVKGTYTTDQLRSGIAIAKLYDDQMHEWEKVLLWMECVELLL